MQPARSPLLDLARSTDAAPYSGTLLRGWRERALLTQEQLAERAGLNVRTVRRMENGGLWQPRTSSLLLLAQALELDGEERALLAAVTRGQPATGEGDEPAACGPAIVPRQLPADVAVLAGRERELAALVNDLGAGTGAGAGTGTGTGTGAGGVAGTGAGGVAVVAVEGMAGVGKTALAVHAAHRLAPRFPGGQLFVDLHGHARTTPPVEPGEALARLLRALGVPGADVPGHLDDRAALYRSVLAERRVLVVLDDAADEHQIHPLLPAGRDCRVIVTSRRRLSCLDEAASLPLDVLPPAAAVALFTRMAGPGRVAGVPREELSEVVARCGLLPLAVRGAAARLRAHATWSVRHLLERLAGDRLAELGAGRHDVAAALDLSCDRLSPEARRAYRLLGSRGGAGFGAGTAAALLGTTPPRAERLLDQLLEAHLVQETAPGRYRLHDLVREHAAAQAAG
ncbi:NB-ARC domain-containing protein [Nonomuraea sp. NPDC050783]|uniref:NB-ARC domain-containing protein n=1 Tax=Nonomuraea sp. NPDC050783 TaxID=3154634 RepID=UPI00346569EC